MPWEYLSLPEPLRAPACPRRGGRLRVTMVLRGVWVCVDCAPAHPFAAVWRDERAVRAVETREERAS